MAVAPVQESSTGTAPSCDSASKIVGSVARIALTWPFARSEISICDGSGCQLMLDRVTLSLWSTDWVATVSRLYGVPCDDAR